MTLIPKIASFSTSHNFWSNHQKISRYSAKSISMIPRIHWKKFQVWVLTKNSSWKSFSYTMKIVKSGNIYFQDEFLGGSSYFIGLICSEIESLSILNVFCTVSQRPKGISDHSRLDWILAIFQLWKIKLCHFDSPEFNLGTILGTILYVFLKHTYQTLFTPICRR